MEEKKTETDKSSQIKEQMEYYLGDENLKKDSFFHEKISADPNGYIELSLFLKCNKIKQAGWTKEDLITGIKLSTELELDEKEEKVRRKDNRALPELTLLSKKRKKEENENEKEEDVKDPVILKFTCAEKCDLSWKDINESFKQKNPGLNINYGRFKEKEGHFAVLLKKNEELKFEEKFNVGDVEFLVEKCEGEDLANFWKDHGTHYEFCLKDKRRKDYKNNKKNNKGKKGNSRPNRTSLKNPVNLGGQRFTDVSIIKAEIRKIMNNCKENEPLKDKEKDLVLDLLKYHHNYEEKSKDMDYVTVGKAEKFSYTRCFIIVKKNKEKVDFSFQKCIDNLFDKANE